MSSISVILPAYNRRELLPKTVETLLNQTFEDFELLIIDDGSTDGTPEWVKAQTDSRIKLIALPENRGVSYARNRGLEIARGKYIAFADSDDFNSENRLEKQFARMEADEDLVLCGAHIKFFGGKNYHLLYREEPLFYKTKAMFQIPFHFPATMVRRSFLEKTGIRFRPEVRSADDYYFLMKVIAKGKATVVPKVLYQYRWHDSSISLGRSGEQAANELAISRMAFAEIMGINLTEEEAKLIYRFYRDRCEPGEKSAVKKLNQKIIAFAKKESNLSVAETNQLATFLRQKYREVFQPVYVGKFFDYWHQLKKRVS